MVTTVQRLLLLLLLSVVVSASSGCTIWNRLRGKEQGDAESEYSTQFRPRASDSQPYFLDDRARQIERNLGM